MFAKNQKFNAFKTEINQVIFHSSPQAQYFPANSNFIKGLSQSSTCLLSKAGKCNNITHKQQTVQSESLPRTSSQCQ